MSKIISEKYKVKDIPVMTFFNPSKKKMPVIFIVHGFTSNKEDTENGVQLGSILAERGYYSVAYDAYMHGERIDSRFTSANEQEQALMMFEIVAHTGDDVETLIEFFSHKEECDTNRIGMTGISMGGFTTFYTVANNNKIKVAVPIIGSPSFNQFALDKLNDDSTNILKGTIDKYKDNRAYIESVDPINKISNFVPKPLLIQNGRYDNIVPSKYSEYLYERLKENYKEYPQRLKLSIYNVGHDVPEDMKQEMADWFEKYL